ncbi:MAG TPA: AMP-binding protein [Steroidobacter sp.]
MAIIPLGDILQHHARSRPAGMPAVVYPGATLTWGELDEQAGRWASQYRSRGVEQDDMVAIALNNGPAHHAAAFAAWKAGATPMLVSPRLPVHEFEAVIRLAAPKLIVNDAAVPGADAMASATRSVGVPTYWKAVCSGGSTGQPKVIVDHMRGEYDPSAPGLHSVLQIPANGVMLNPGPLYHNGPFLFSSLGLFVGCTLVGMERFDPEEALRLIEAHRVNWVSFVPTMMHRIWSLPASVRDRYDLSSLKIMLHMAAPCPAWLKQAWIDWLGGERIWEIYAGTEGYGATFIRGDEWLERRGSVGRPVRAQIRAMNDAGETCEPGEIGELYFLPDNGASPSHYLGAETRRDSSGWVSIGDLGHLDADGYVYLADRRMDLIIRGGANIYPAEIEAALDQHPAVASSIVIGVPDEEMGARVHAIVEPVSGAQLDIEDLHAHLAGHLAKYKLPESYEISAAPLRDDTGKARRSALRDERTRWMQEGRAFKVSRSG